MDDWADDGEEAAPKAKTIKLPKAAKVKNKMPASMQITAEQLLREAKERELEVTPLAPKQRITDEAELDSYRLNKRKEYEDNIRKNRTQIGNWLKYAAWEDSQGELQRARSVFERALDVDHRNVHVWLRYAEVEMKNKQVNHARNIWDRAVTIMPRTNQFWYKYTYMEEKLKNIAGARQAFERWIEWQPDEQAWHSYINFELRYKELHRARLIYEKFVIVHPEVKNWVKFARFEEKHGFVNSARKVFERGIEYFGDENLDENLLVEFAKFEERQKEHERARVIYKYGLDCLPKERCETIYKNYTIHEKKFGERTAIEDVIVSKRKFQYEEEIKANPSNYDAWFDYLRLLEEEGDIEIAREAYEKAIANVPPVKEKQYWRRYIYLWIKYAIFEELEAQDIDRAMEVYTVCLDLIPHKTFTFAKIWLMAAQCQIRRNELQRARRLLGASIGKCPKDKLFRGYIELEIQLREFDRCRLLYEKFLLFNPENVTTWTKYAELESILGDTDRARAIFELAIEQPLLDMPEILWKAYIDFEVENQEWDNARALYRKLLRRTQHVKVWVSFARFEHSITDDKSLERARDVWLRAYKSLKQVENKEERVMLIEAWLEWERDVGTSDDIEAVEKKIPRKVKKRRKIEGEDGTGGWEEYYDYIFEDEEGAQPNLKLLEIAKKWKAQADPEPTINQEEIVL